MPDFETVHSSDPSPANGSKAREFLADWARCHGLNTALEFSQCSGEETYNEVGEKQADMVICATASHFMDPDALIDSCAKMLRPGGTLAIFSYWMPFFPRQSQRFQDLFLKAYQNLAHKPLLQSVNDANRAQITKYVARTMSGDAPLDCLPLPEEIFDDPRRVYINNTIGKKPYFDMYLELTPTKSIKDISRVNSRDRIVSYRSGRDLEAEGWAFEASKEWIDSFFDTLPTIESGRKSAEGMRAYEEWEQVFKAECPTGNVEIVWPAYIVLATQKDTNA